MLNPLSRFRVRRRSARTALRIGQLEDRTVPALTVVSAGPAPEWVPIPMTYVDLTFNKPVDPLSVQPSDLLLFRNGSSFGSVTGAQVVPGTNSQTLRFTLGGLTSAGQLTTQMRPQAVATPNGEQSDAYTANYTLTSLGFDPVKPLGSLIYTSPTKGGNTFTFGLEAGQTVTLVASGPTASGTVLNVTLRGPAGVTGAGPVVGTAAAPAFGASAVLQTVVAPSTGLYTATITGSAVGAAPNLKVYLNAAQELEGTGPGLSNNTPATAQDLTNAFWALGAGTSAPTRAGVAGTFTGSPDHYAIPLQAGQTVGVGLGQANPSDRVFGAATAVSVVNQAGNNPSDVAVGDIDGNGVPDLVHTLANGGGPGSVVVQYAFGSGTYLQGAPTFSGGYNPRAIRLADFNGDGKLDAVVADEPTGVVGVMFGTGNNPFAGETPAPSFSDPVAYAAGPLPRSLAVGDLDRDGDFDIVIGNGQGNFLGVLLNNGNGTFAPLASYSAGGFIANGVAIGDVTGDGIPDIVDVTVDNANLNVLPGIGNGTFGTPVMHPAGGSNPQDVALADFNRDGRLDAAALVRAAPAPAPVSVFLNQGSPTDPFSAVPTVTTTGAAGSSSPRYRLAVADFDLDGKPDLAAATGATGVVSVLLGNGTGGFDVQQFVNLAPTGPSNWIADGMTAADVNGDGTPDLATANPTPNPGANNVSVIPNVLSRLRADVVDASGAVLAAGVPTANLASSIPAFTAPAAGTYYLRVSGVGRSDYAAVVTRGGAAFDAEPNDTAAAAQVVGRTGALGHVGKATRLFNATLPNAGGPGLIQEVNPATGAVIRTFSAPNNQAFTANDSIGLAFDGTSLFYIRFAGTPFTLFELDPDTGAVRDADAIPYNSNVIDGLAALNGKVYLTDAGGQRLLQFDPVTDTLTNVFGGWPGLQLRGGTAGATGPDRIIATAGSPFGGNAQVVEIDPATGRVTASFATGGTGTTPIPQGAVRGVAFIDGQVYVTRSDGAPRTDVYSRSGLYLRTLAASALTLSLGGDDVGQSTADWYSVSIPEGDVVRLATSTPGDGPGGFANALDPHLELFDAGGALVTAGAPGPDGRNETLVFAPSAAGTFKVKVTGQNNTLGEYFLSSAVFPNTNQAPDAVNDTPSTDEDTAVDVPVLANDADPDGDPVTVETVTQPAHGTARINADGTVRYTPAANYFGADTFTYTVSDGNWAFDTASVFLTINPVNDAPTAGNDAYTTNEDTPVTRNAPGVLANDNDADGDTLFLEVRSGPAHGNLALNQDGSFTYAPARDYNGTDAFTYAIIDPYGAEATATVSLTVKPVNDAPFAGNRSATGMEDTPETLNVNDIASDADGDPLAIASVTQPAHGTATIGANGTTVTYTPALNYNGPDSFTFTVSDGQATATATLSWQLAPQDDPPVGVADAYTTDEGTTLNVPAAAGLLANDIDVDGDGLAVETFSNPAHGAVAVNADGSFTYAPVPGYSGTDAFNYRLTDGHSVTNVIAVSLTVRSVNDAPDAVNDAATVSEDGSVNVAVLANDTDPDGDALTASAVTQPAHGAAVINADGTVTYTPAANYNGADSFTYTASDGNGGTDTATVNITVTPVNDAPAAGNDSYSVDEDATLTAAAPGVLGNDTDADGDPLTATLATGPAHAAAFALNADGSFTYAPVANYNGSDGFTYTVTDGNGGSATGTVSLTVRPANDTPDAADDAATTAEDNSVTVSVLANDTDADGDSLAVSALTQPAHGAAALNADGTVTYTPTANYNGTDSFTYSVSDGNGGSDTATVALTVTPVNDNPVAGADGYSVDEDQSLSAAAPGVLGNDTDADGDPLTATLATGPAHAASFALNADGSFSYTPAANYNGTDAFTYSASDGNGGSATGTVSLTIRSVNDTPDAANDAATVAEDNAVNVAVLGNDTDADGDTLTVSAITQPAHGTAAVNPDGTVKYTPAANYYGADAFTYTVSDGNGGSDTATVNIAVSPVNDPPVARTDAYAVDEDQTLTVGAATGLLANDTDADGDALTVSGFTNPAHGTLAVTSDGSLTYTPAANYNGSDSFTYTATDGHGGTATGTVNLTVRPVNDVPVAAADAYAVNEDATLTVPAATGVLANDTDADGDALTTVLVGGPAHGSLSLNPDGGFTYTPAANFFGSDSFTYRPTDGTAVGALTTVALAVNPVNDAPGFVGGPNQTGAEDSGPRTVANWATGISAGPANEGGQALTFMVVGNSNPGLFGAGPAVSSTGTLTFTPAPDAYGTATVQVRLRDDGGTANGGADQSPVYTFTITVTPLTQVAAVTVNQGAIQRSKVTRVAVTFDGVVTLDAGAFTLTGTTRTGAAQSVQTVTVSTAVVGGRTVATLSFSGRGTDQGSLADGLWTLRVIGSKVHDTSTGLTMAADYTYGLHRLFGDANGDRRVDSVDKAAFDAAYGTRLGQAGYVDYFDFDANGAIERKDRDQFNTRYGAAL